MIFRWWKPCRRMGTFHAFARYNRCFPKYGSGLYTKRQSALWIWSRGPAVGTGVAGYLAPVADVNKSVGRTRLSIPVRLRKSGKCGDKVIAYAPWTGRRWQCTFVSERKHFPGRWIRMWIPASFIAEAVVFACTFGQRGVCIRFQKGDSGRRTNRYDGGTFRCRCLSQSRSAFFAFAQSGAWFVDAEMKFKGWCLRMHLPRRECICQ